MGFSITWHIEKQVILLKIFDEVTSSDVLELNETAQVYLEADTHPIHLIIDTLEVKEYPTNLRWILRMIRENPVPPTGWIILVEDDPTIRVLASTILSMLRLPLHICTALSEAHDFLETHIYADAT